MKPGSRDHRHRLLISGDELRELKQHTGSMTEAFGLDRKIENYKGTRPLTPYRWDLDCLMDVIDLALRDERDYPDRSSPGYLALKHLGERLHQEYEAVYGHEQALSASKKESGDNPKKKVAAGKSAKTPGTVYPFKITLLDTQPPIWRRIQVQDCTLDKLHEHIQTAMGWTNSHLHHFRIGEQLYGDPMLMADNFEEMEYEDSTTTKLSDIIPEGRRRFRLLYEYDFGDSWQHEVLFEKKVEAEAGQKYPLCVDGARACPPEDVEGSPMEAKNMTITNMKQTAELIGVTYSALQSAIFHKKIPEPKLKIGSHKLFDPGEIEIARRYFEENRKRREARKRS